jgi:hypothetical protein
MPRKISNRREDTRHAVPGALGARIEFQDGDGLAQKLPLIDVSAGGASFSMPRRLPGIEKGAMLGDVLIRVAQIEVQGNLEVLHTTRGFGSDYSCGVRFFPKTESDRNLLVELVSRLERLPKV